MRLSFYPSLGSEYDDNTEDLEKASGLGAEMELLIDPRYEWSIFYISMSN
jgi:hypothetical protein